MLPKPTETGASPTARTSSSFSGSGASSKGMEAAHLLHLERAVGGRRAELRVGGAHHGPPSRGVLREAVAVARELSGFVWALMTRSGLTPQVA